jgi:hypothetical protein
MKITLQIPDGKNCKGCMFLDISFLENRADCLLFKNERVTYKTEYGDLIEESVQKCKTCLQITRNNE